MNSNRDSSFWGVVILVIAAIVMIVIWKFSQLLGIDFPTGKDVLIRLGLVALAWTCIWKAASFTFQSSWPLFLSSIWFCFWPALDYWGGFNHSDDFFAQFSTPEWYATSLWQWSVLAGIVAVGYIINSWIND